MSDYPTEIVVQATTAKLRAKDVHEKMVAIVYDELSKLPALLEQMEPKERLAYIFRLIPFAVPSLQEISPTLYDDEFLVEQMESQNRAIEKGRER